MPSMKRPHQVSLFGWASGFKNLKGFETVMQNLNTEINNIHGATLKGLIRAQIQVRRDMDRIPPKIPVDTGNLRSSYFCTTSDGKILAGTSPEFSEKQRGTDRPRADVERVRTEHAEKVTDQWASANQQGRTIGPTVIFGFTAYYAHIVHEMVGANFHRRGAGAKFFEEAVKRNKDKILAIVAKEAKIRK